MPIKNVTRCAECAKKDKLITELANALDELSLETKEFNDSIKSKVDLGRKLIERKAIKDIAWPPRTGRREPGQPLL